jgi:hypothetical protein
MALLAVERGVADVVVVVEAVAGPPRLDRGRLHVEVVAAGGFAGELEADQIKTRLTAVEVLRRELDERLAA